MNYIIEDFIGVFDNAVGDEYCDQVIQHYNYMESWKKTVSRQEHEGAQDIYKKNDQYFFENEQDSSIISSNALLAQHFSVGVWACYKYYAQTYGVLSSLAPHHMSESIKIQKTLPSGGYHVWHCENDALPHGRRMILAMLYLNDVEEGGETEFLYQSKRFKPKKGTMILCPTGYTHTHRGNPPLSGPKYLMNTWLEFK